MIEDQSWAGHKVNIFLSVMTHDAETFKFQHRNLVMPLLGCCTWSHWWFSICEYLFLKFPIVEQSISQIEYFNNKIICDLVEVPHKGVLAILDEACLNVGKVTDQMFLDSLSERLGQHEHLVTRKVYIGHFQIFSELGCPWSLVTYKMKIYLPTKTIKFLKHASFRSRLLWQIKFV